MAETRCSRCVFARTPFRIRRSQKKPENKEEENQKEIWKVLFSIVSRIIPTEHLKVNTVHIWCNQMCTHVTYCVRAGPKEREREKNWSLNGARWWYTNIYSHCALGITCALNYCSHSDIHLVITRAARCLRAQMDSTQKEQVRRGDSKQKHTHQNGKHIINTGARDAWMSKLNKRGEWATTSLR